MKTKTAPFLIDGPYYQSLQSRKTQAHVVSGRKKLHTMQDWHGVTTTPQAALDYIMLPRVKFQAELRYHIMDNGRIIMHDVYGRQWSVFPSSADEVLPTMQMGKITAWWSMVKKTNTYGLVVDTKQPLLARVPQNEDIPLMLEKAADLNTVIPYFEAMAI